MSNVTKKKEDTNETKNVPPPTSEGDQGRVTAETVVTDGPSGLRRMIALTTHILTRPRPGGEAPDP